MTGKKGIISLIIPIVVIGIIVILFIGGSSYLAKKSIENQPMKIVEKEKIIEVEKQPEESSSPTIDTSICDHTDDGGNNIMQVGTCKFIQDNYPATRIERCTNWNEYGDYVDECWCEVGLTVPVSASLKCPSNHYCRNGQCWDWNGDSDNDGYSDTEEYNTYDTDPHNPNSYPVSDCSSICSNYDNWINYNDANPPADNCEDYVVGQCSPYISSLKDFSGCCCWTCSQTLI